MQDKNTPTIDLHTAMMSLRQEYLISESHLKSNLTPQSSTLCFILFHSHEVEEFINQKQPGSFIYVARAGKSFDGHTLAQKVLDANQFFVGDAQKYISHPHFIPVFNTEKALNCILKQAYQISSHDFLSIGITGTNGKTSTTQITAQLLEILFAERVLKIGTLGIQIGNETQSGSHVTTPDFPSFLSALNWAKTKSINKLVMEVTSHGLKENRLANWTFNVGVFTNLTQDHLDYHKTMDDYRASKQALFSNSLKDDACAVVNVSSQEGLSFVKAAENKKTHLLLINHGPSIKTQLRPYQDKFQSVSLLEIENQKSDLLGLSGTFLFTNKSSSDFQTAAFSCPLIGHFQLENLLCSVGAALALGFSLQEIVPILTQIKNIPGRLELICEKTHPLAPKVVVDYAHTPDALEKAILTCKNSLSKTGKLTTVFGCGGDRDPSKRAPMGKIASTLSHRVVVTSDNPRTENPEKIIDDIFNGIHTNQEIFREADRAKAIKYAILTSTENDLVLVAGKGHEDYQQIGHIKHPFSDAAVVKDILLQNYPTGRA